MSKLIHTSQLLHKALQKSPGMLVVGSHQVNYHLKGSSLEQLYGAILVPDFEAMHCDLHVKHHIGYLIFVVSII